MPSIGKKKSSDPKGKSGKMVKSGRGRPSRPKHEKCDRPVTVVEDLDDAVVEEVASPAEPVARAEPFNGDVVHPSLKGLLVIPRLAGAEGDVVKGFLRYYSLTTLFIGTITTRTSFMHKKGGVLL